MNSIWLYFLLITKVTAEVGRDNHEHIGNPLAKKIKKTGEKIIPRHARPLNGRPVAGEEVAPPNSYSSLVERDNHEHIGSPLAKKIKKTGEKIIPRRARPLNRQRVADEGVAPPNSHSSLVERDNHEHIGSPLAKKIKKTGEKIIPRRARPVNGRLVADEGVAPPQTYSSMVERDYHEHIGFALAKKIKKMEEKIIPRRAKPRDGRRVAGGGVAPPNFYPYLGGLIIEMTSTDNLSVCGSTLITNDALLTAAHCWRSQIHLASQFTVVLASEFLFTGGTRVVTSDVLMHPQFEFNPMRNDIAIIRLPIPVPFTDTIKPAALPQANVTETVAGDWVIAAGYGRTKTDLPVTLNSVISHVRLQVITEEACKPHFEKSKVQSSNICTNGTGGVGACDGDAGGPLISIRRVKPVLVGITSFVSERSCEEGSPSVFVRVTSYLPFILDHIKV